MSKISDNYFDVVVIGASLSGSYAATLLSQNNKKVLLIEKESSPCKRVCGEGLSAGALKFINKIGASEKFNQTPKRNLNAYNLNISNGREQMCLRMHGFNGFGINRRDLDSFMFTQAKEAGVSVLKETKVKQVVPGEKIEVRTSVGKFFAKNVVIAAGKATNLCKELSIPERIINIKQIGLSAKFQFAELSYKPIDVEILSEPQIQIMLTPLPDNQANISIHTSPEFIKTQKSYQGTLEKLQQYIEDKLLAAGIKGQLGSLGAISNICVYRRAPYHQGIYLIGDSIQQLNPLGGMGMTHALITADVAATDILKSSANKNCIQTWIYQLEILIKSAPIRIFSKLSELGLKQIIPLKIFTFLAQQTPTVYFLKLIHHA